MNIKTIQDIIKQLPWTEVWLTSMWNHIANCSHEDTDIESYQHDSITKWVGGYKISHDERMHKNIQPTSLIVDNKVVQVKLIPCDDGLIPLIVGSTNLRHSMELWCRLVIDSQYWNVSWPEMGELDRVDQLVSFAVKNDIDIMTLVNLVSDRLEFGSCNYENYLYVNGLAVLKTYFPRCAADIDEQINFWAKRYRPITLVENNLTSEIYSPCGKTWRELYLNNRIANDIHN